MNTRLSLIWLPLAVGLVLVGSSTAAGRPTKRLSDEAKGLQLYDRHCVQCHGDHAAGDGPLANTLVKPVPDLTGVLDEDHRDRHVTVVLEGNRSMPSFKNAFDRFDAERVMRHMERIVDPEYARPDRVVPKPKPRRGVPSVNGTPTPIAPTAVPPGTPAPEDATAPSPDQPSPAPPPPPVDDAPPTPADEAGE